MNCSDSYEHKVFFTVDSFSLVVNARKVFPLQTISESESIKSLLQRFITALVAFSLFFLIAAGHFCCHVQVRDFSVTVQTHSLLIEALLLNK